LVGCGTARIPWEPVCRELACALPEAGAAVKNPFARSRAHFASPPGPTQETVIAHAADPPRPTRFAPSPPLTGTIAAPGDKSISHRAIILAGLAIGTSRISRLLDSGDVAATIAAMRAMGARIERDGADWIVDGVGVGGLLQPQGALDMGNSGTSARLLMGLLASHAIGATFIGDASLSLRPMARVAEPLAAIGAAIVAAPGTRLPLSLRGLAPAIPYSYRLPIASAQVKSALLLAGLNTPGVTRVIEPVATRDHSERMLAAFGADIAVERDDDGVRTINLRGKRDLRPCDIMVPGDISSAAFAIVAALLVPRSRVTVTGVGINPRRAGLLRVLAEMGGDIVLANERDVGGEPVADITASHTALRGIAIAADRASDMIDEFPILFVAASMAHGRTVARGLGELRHKEADRLGTMAAALTACGASVRIDGDTMIIDGSGGIPLPGSATIAARHDHRIAMSMAVAGLASRDGVTIDDMASVATSFPGFVDLIERLQAGA
jgi:3-phosphoshikimate 1-carboxyvinyltransferase